MAIRIRLVRTGKRNRPFFRIVAVDRKKGIFIPPNVDK